jgi:hypothetical protein
MPQVSVKRPGSRRRIVALPAEVNIEERARQRQFTGNIPAFAVDSPVDVIETVPTLCVHVALRSVEQRDPDPPGKHI